MTFSVEDVAFIKELVQNVIHDIPEVRNANVRYELDLRDRVIRVEEELKHQRELMQEGFRLMDKRFEQVDKRFEQVDKRFEDITKRHDRQFMWLISFIAVVGGVVISAIKFLP